MDSIEVIQAPQSQEFTINHGDIFRLRSSIVEIVEDLKLRKAVEKENEDKINQLVCEKHELERSLESEKEKRQSLEEQHHQEVQHVKQQCEERLKTLEEEQKQFQIMKHCAEKDMTALKEEARALQVTKYKLEKRVKELETKLGTQENLSETQLSQVTDLENKVIAVKAHYRRLEGSQSRLDKNVEEAMKLNCSLMCVNKHQQCVIDQLRKDTTKLTSQVVEARAASQQSSGDVMIERQQLKEEIHRLKVQNSTLEVEKSTARRELESCQDHWRKSLANLKTAQRLIDQHQEQTYSHQAQLQTLEDQVHHLRQELDDLRTRHQQAVERTEQLSTQLREQEAVWAEKVSAGEKEMDRVREELQNREDRLRSSQDLVFDLQHRLQNTAQQLEDTLARLNVDRDSAGSQTDVSIFMTSTASVQTEIRQTDVSTQLWPDTRVMGTQTLKKQQQQGGSQTDIVIMTSASSQTLVPCFLSQSAQTLLIQVSNGWTQTETNRNSPQKITNTTSFTKEPLTSDQQQQSQLRPTGANNSHPQPGQDISATHTNQTHTDIPHDDPDESSDGPMTSSLNAIPCMTTAVTHGPTSRVVSHPPASVSTPHTVSVVKSGAGFTRILGGQHSAPSPKEAPARQMITNDSALRTEISESLVKEKTLVTTATHFLNDQNAEQTLPKETPARLMLTNDFALRTEISESLVKEKTMVTTATHFLNDQNAEQTLPKEDSLTIQSFNFETQSNTKTTLSLKTPLASVVLTEISCFGDLRLPEKQTAESVRISESERSYRNAPSEADMGQWQGTKNKTSTETDGNCSSHVVHKESPGLLSTGDILVSPPPPDPKHGNADARDLTLTSEEDLILTPEHQPALLTSLQTGTGIQHPNQTLTSYKNTIVDDGHRRNYIKNLKSMLEDRGEVQKKSFSVSSFKDLSLKSLQPVVSLFPLPIPTTTSKRSFFSITDQSLTAVSTVNVSTTADKVQVQSNSSPTGVGGMNCIQSIAAVTIPLSSSFSSSSSFSAIPRTRSDHRGDRWRGDLSLHKPYHSKMDGTSCSATNSQATSSAIVTSSVALSSVTSSVTLSTESQGGGGLKLPILSSAFPVPAASSVGGAERGTKLRKVTPTSSVISPRRTALLFSSYGKATAAVTSASPVKKPACVAFRQSDTKARTTPRSVRSQPKLPTVTLSGAGEPKTPLPVIKKGILKGAQDTGDGGREKTVTFAPIEERPKTDFSTNMTPSSMTNNDSNDDQSLFSDDDNDNRTQDAADSDINRQCKRIVGLLEKEDMPTPPRARKRKRDL